MGIKGKDLFPPSLAHDFKTGAVYQRKIAPVGGQKGAHALLMDRLAHPVYFQHRQQITLKKPEGDDPKAVLEDG